MRFRRSPDDLSPYGLGVSVIPRSSECASLVAFLAYPSRAGGDKKTLSIAKLRLYKDVTFIADTEPPKPKNTEVMKKLLLTAIVALGMSTLAQAQTWTYFDVADGSNFVATANTYNT